MPRQDPHLIAVGRELGTSRVKRMQAIVTFQGKEAMLGGGVFSDF
jgi:hypothetical protein